MNIPNYDIDTAWNLLTMNHFTEDELQLVTDISGYSMATIDMACRARYGMDFEQLVVEEGWDKE